MRRAVAVFVAAVSSLVGTTTATDFAEVCTSEYVQSVLPGDGFIPGTTIDTTSVAVNAIGNYSSAASDGVVGVEAVAVCNVTFGYTHDGKEGKTNVWYYLPDPANFKNRFLSTGGGGFSITSGAGGLSGGLSYGAASGTTDAGLGSWSAQLTNKVLYANGSMNYDALYAFSHQAIHEMTVLGQELTKAFFGVEKIYSYYSGCSEGGRDGFSQLQRYGTQFDGAAVGAPAMRMAFQQVIHLFSAMVEITNNYFPPTCELTRINNDTIAACDLLDGKQDGVVSRTDLCKLHYNATSSIGNSYACAAGSGTSSPAVNGTVSDQAAELVKDLWAGLFDSQGRQAYIMFQPSSDFGDAGTTYNAETGQYEASVSGIGVQWVNYFLKKVISADLDLTNASYDTLRDWIIQGIQEYSDTLETNWPDLEDIREYGGKIIHYHGESDNSVPSGSSVIYHDAVRQAMYPDETVIDGYTKLNSFYRFYLVPGAGHCGRSQSQPNGPFPSDILGSVIDWVENDSAPEQLPATTTSGVSEDLCLWPTRPLWSEGSDEKECVFDQESYESWLPKLDSIPVPVW
ncbi:tannase [Truncatella angustata]|uniref:Carboxylic ester hydrolase n=1 Tax=Truncatella angustata TaxID=152316 RepID=A0A9P9A5M0_9PEZI|nr:tannase [Truncatella angustata]KAH6660979.1 tannase [Truncatella angustata]